MQRMSVVLVLAALLLAGGGVLAQSGGPYDLGWQALGSAGEQVAAGGGYRIGFTLAQDTPPLVSAGGGYRVAQGFWAGAGGPAQPMAVADLRAAVVSGHLRLDWTAVNRDVAGGEIAGVTYNVYRAVDAPYFTAGAPYASGIAGTQYVDPDGSVIGNTTQGAYYFVRAAYAGLLSAPSNRAGACAFALVPGN